MKVEQVMTREVVTVRPSTPLREVAQILTGRRISGLPVVADDGSVLGVVSGADLLVKERSPELPRGRLHRARGTRPLLAARTAGEAMTAPAVCIGSDRPLSEAADLMTTRHVSRLPVAEADGTLVGIVTRADLVRAFLRSDAEIEQELHELLGDNGLDVEVAGGEVTLRGVVATRRDAVEATRRARTVTGAVGVCSRLLWSERTR